MQWAEVTKTRETRELRQFARLCLLAGAVLAVWRLWSGADQPSAYAVAAAFLTVGAIGVVAPRAIARIYTGWMIVVFPIGWTVSRLIVAAMFFGLFMPVALVFRWIGRDALRLRSQPAASLWIPKRQPDRAQSYLRQY